MDEQFAGIVEAVIYSAAAVGAVYVVAKHWYLARKVRYETAAERMTAAKSLLESEQYQAYLKKRAELTDRILHSSDGPATTTGINHLVNNALGKFNPE